MRAGSAPAFGWQAAFGTNAGGSKRLFLKQGCFESFSLEPGDNLSLLSRIGFQEVCPIYVSTLTVVVSGWERG
jgi:hypothetical protein